MPLVAQVEVHEYSVCCYTRSSSTVLWTVTVRRTYSAGDSWMVYHPPTSYHSVELGEQPRVLDSKGRWSAKLLMFPTSAAESTWRAEHCFPLDQALALARVAAANLIIDGRPIAEMVAAIVRDDLEYQEAQKGTGF